MEDWGPGGVAGVAGVAIRVAGGTAIGVAGGIGGVASSRARDAYVAGKGL